MSENRTYRITFWNRTLCAVDSLLFECHSIQEAIDQALAENNVEESELISIHIMVPV